jgi:hypothetical protein
MVVLALLACGGGVGDEPTWTQTLDSAKFVCPAGRQMAIDTAGRPFCGRQVDSW